MITVDIPGSEKLELENLVLDYNGTIAADGELIACIEERLLRLAKELTIYVVTADTHGSAQKKLMHLPCTVELLSPGAQDEQKRDVIRKLGAKTTASIGNGRNDALMLRESVLGIGVCQLEGASTMAINAADVITMDINDALDLMLHPLRLIATLRN